MKMGTARESARIQDIKDYESDIVEDKMSIMVSTPEPVPAQTTDEVAVG